MRAVAPAGDTVEEPIIEEPTPKEDVVVPEIIETENTAVATVSKSSPVKKTSILSGLGAGIASMLSTI